MEHKSFTENEVFKRSFIRSSRQQLHVELRAVGLTPVAFRAGLFNQLQHLANGNGFAYSREKGERQIKKLMATNFCRTAVEKQQTQVKEENMK